MALALSYDTLTSQLQSFMGDIGTRFTAEIETIIQKAETRLLRELNLSIFDVTVSSMVFTEGDEMVAKPTGWIATRELIYLAGTVRSILRPRSYEYCVDYAPDTALTGTPKYYHDLDEARFLIAPTPAATSQASICRYLKRPAGLSSGNSTTWLSNNAPDLLLEGSMVESQKWAKNKDGEAVWEARYVKTLAAAKQEFHTLIRTL